MSRSPTGEREQQYKQAHAVGQFLGGMDELNEARRERNARRSVQHLGEFRCGHGVLRKPNGRFAKETTERHRRPKRIPWNVEV